MRSELQIQMNKRKEEAIFRRQNDINSFRINLQKYDDQKLKEEM